MDDQEKGELIAKLDNMILGAVPGAHAVSKYGGTLYTLKPDEKEAQFCGVFPYNSHVQLAFSQGTMLADPKKLLAGKGKMRKHINLEKIQDIDTTALVHLLKDAVRISNSINT